MRPVTRRHGTAARPRGTTSTPRASLRQTHGGRSANAGFPLWTSRTTRSPSDAQPSGSQFFVSQGGQFRMSFDHCCADVYSDGF
jgi:hypothetical protein